MSGPYYVEIVREGVKAETSPGSGEFTEVAVGTIISGDRWVLLHCLNGFRNKPAVAVPADEDTAEAVSKIVAERAPQKAAEMRMMQKRIDALAASDRFKIDPKTGFFQRDGAGELSGKMSKVERHIMETAVAYGIKPNAEPKTDAEAAPKPAAAEPKRPVAESKPAASEPAAVDSE